MAKTKKDVTETEGFYEGVSDNETVGASEYQGVDDFDVEEDFVPIPLIAEGYYNSAVTDVKFNSEDKTIDWSFTLNDNGGVMSDGETPIDGSVHVYRNWLPKPGDEERNDQEGNSDKEASQDQHAS